MPGQVSNAVNEQIKQLALDLDKQVAIQKQYGQEGGQALDESYANLGGQLQGNLAETTGIVDRGRGTLQSDYDAAGGNINNAASTLQALLGPQGVGGSNGFNSAQQEIQRLAAENSASEANSLGSFNILGTGYEAAGQKAIGDAATEGVNRRADLTSSVGASIGDLQRDYQTKRADMGVQLAQVLFQEEEAAAARASAARSASAKTSKIGQGRSGLLQWAAENGVGPAEMNIIMNGINQGSQSGKYADAYAYANAASKKANSTNPYNKGNAGTLYKDGAPSRPKGVLAPGPNMNTISTGLDVYYGRYS
jgi:hypothetical protein